MKMAKSKRILTEKELTEFKKWASKISLEEDKEQHIWCEKNKQTMMEYYKKVVCEPKGLFMFI